MVSFRLVLIGILALLAAMAAVAQQPAQTFTVKEVFGVTHPDQIIDFDLMKPVDAQRAYLLGPDGKEVPYQLLDDGKKLAVRTDLPANSEKTWRLMVGRAPKAVPVGVTMTESPTFYELANSLCGVRLPKPQPNAGQTLAPIQGIRLRDGQWTAIGPNVLSIPAKTLEVAFIERGPLKTVARLTYTFEQPTAGTYTSTVEIHAGQPSILIEEEGNNVQVNYTLDIRAGINPDTGRARRTFGEPYHGPGPEEEVSLAKNRTWRLANWDQWVYDGGWQLLAFKRDAPATANTLGLFDIRANRLLAVGNSRMQLISRDGAVTAHMQLAPQRYGGAEWTHNRFAWGLYLGMHGEITAPEKVQPIDRQRNLHSGMNLNKFHRLRFDFPEPPGKFGSMYMSREAVDRLIARMRNESAFYNYIYDSEPYFRPMLFMLQDTTGAKIHEAATLVEKKAHDVLDFLVNAYGIQDKHVHYYEGVFNVVNFFYMADQVLASPLATEEDKAKARKGIALFASIWTDDNHTPGQEDTGLNYGTANMPLTFGAFRDMFIVYLAGDPAYTARAKQVAARLGHNLTTQINEHGAHMGGMHYIEASFSALVSNMLLLRQAGIADFFADDAKHGSRLTKFAEFMMHALTPPDPRFGNIRKMIATGDGSYESADRYGVLATGFAQANPALSARLMGAWTQNGRHHAAMFGSSVMKVDDELPAKDPALGSATFPGYYSVLRAGWGTPHETAVWFINGDWYRDHKHPGDGGEVIIYALSAPLSLDFGSMYSPHAPGAEYHSVVHPGGQAPKVEAFDANARGGMSRATFDLPNNGKWTRAVSLGLLTDDLPVIAIQDTIAGGGDRTWQLNLMTDELRTAEGPRAVGQPFTLPAGITALEMTGQRWAKHAAQGIDGMLYLVTPTPRPVEIAAWKHNWHPATEQYQFQRANERGFEERQLLLRVKGDGSLRAILVPYYKGQKPTDLKVMLEGDQVIVSAGGKSLRLTQDGRMQTPH